MANSEKVVWTGKSGTEYSYWIHSKDTKFEDEVPANYIYAVSGTTGWIAIYVGETGDISDRPLDTHHKKGCIESNGATHIHVHKSSNDEDTRRAEEADLVANYNPPCND